MPILGIDFDNTLVCYDTLFHAVALEQGLIPASTPPSKELVRDTLRELGREADWVSLQGLVYGLRIEEAELFEGVRAALSSITSQGWLCVIISHKTQTPFAGPSYDLHAAARSFLKRHNLLAPEGPIDRAYFELTKDAKAKRIGEQGCAAFIDDLPEIFELVDFPRQTKKILFNPLGNPILNPHTSSVSSWLQLPSLLTPLHGT